MSPLCQPHLGDPWHRGEQKVGLTPFTTALALPTKETEGLPNGSSSQEGPGNIQKVRVSSFCHPKLLTGHTSLPQKASWGWSQVRQKDQGKQEARSLTSGGVPPQRDGR